MSVSPLAPKRAATTPRDISAAAGVLIAMGGALAFWGAIFAAAMWRF
jgi:hypothetical protein